MGGESESGRMRVRVGRVGPRGAFVLNDFVGLIKHSWAERKHTKPADRKLLQRRIGEYRANLQRSASWYHDDKSQGLDTGPGHVKVHRPPIDDAEAIAQLLDVPNGKTFGAKELADALLRVVDELHYAHDKTRAELTAALAKVESTTKKLDDAKRTAEEQMTAARRSENEAMEVKDGELAEAREIIRKKEDESSEARRLNTELTKARGVDQDTSRRTLEELVKKKDAEIAEFNRIAVKAVHAKSEESEASERLADASRKEATRVANEGNEEARKRVRGDEDSACCSKEPTRVRTIIYARECKTEGIELEALRRRYDGQEEKCKSAEKVAVDMVVSLPAKESELSAEKKKLETCEADLVQTRGAVEAANAKVINLEKELEQRTEEIEGLQGGAEHVQSTLDSTEKRYLQLAQTKLELDGEINTMAMELEQSRSAIEQTHRALRTTKGEEEKLEANSLSPKASFVRKRSRLKGGSTSLGPPILSWEPKCEMPHEMYKTKKLHQSRRLMPSRRPGQQTKRNQQRERSVGGVTARTGRQDRTLQ
ncbi:unnamed protein product [Zymoseptoria tritici ST99CH_1A5]|uniref:Uncharacterized protein n=1 Tax=Zymoseptoria tritici ST99CH_1A5 TaxID=1276529 RepID=A0A1Y6LUK1_ZYMTR|nr:unnamed protein product [Zymoseptoria tritici ST99CH_1A5]